MKKRKEHWPQIWRVFASEARCRSSVKTCRPAFGLLFRDQNEGCIGSVTKNKTKKTRNKTLKAMEAMFDHMTWTLTAASRLTEQAGRSNTKEDFCLFFLFFFLFCNNNKPLFHNHSTTSTPRTSSSDYWNTINKAAYDELVENMLGQFSFVTNHTMTRRTRSCGWGGEK